MAMQSGNFERGIGTERITDFSHTASSVGESGARSGIGMKMHFQRFGHGWISRAAGLAAVAAYLFFSGAVSTWAQTTQPIVAVHDSELTRALETMTASNGTPSGAGTTGNQWWTTNWHYFVMADSVKQTLRADGTAFTVVGDSN